MANMSYCRFENTARDMADCFGEFEEFIADGGTLNEFVESLSSDYERKSFYRLVQLAQQLVDLHEEVEP